MAGGSFQLGSIIATIKLDSKQFIKQLESLKKSVANIDIKWKGTAGFHTSAQNIIGKLGLVKNAAQGISVSAKVFSQVTGNNLVKTANATNSGFLKLAKTMGSFVNVQIPRAIGGFFSLGSAAKQFFVGFAGWFKRFFLGPFAILQRSIFTWKNLIAVVLARAMITRAKDLETVAAGFDHLAASIGDVSGVLITKLRSATKGTVSDFRLMQTANSAVLLGVAQTGDELAEMAELARRLGKAVGRDAVAAFQDLATGIGRQSRLILDNLGLQVRTQQAYEDYATILDKTVDELTDAEKKQGFLNAAMEQARIKVKRLGPDVLGVAEAWGVLEAAVINAFDAFSKGFVGGEIATAIGDFVNANLVAIQGAGITAKIALGDFVRGVFGGIGDLIEANHGSIINAVKDLIKAVGITALRLIIDLATSLANAVIKIVKQHGAKIVEAVVSITSAALYGLTRTFVSGLDLVLPDTVKFFLGFDKEDIITDLDAFFGYVSDETKDRIEELKKELADEFGYSLDTEEGKLRKRLRSFLEAARSIESVPRAQAGPMGPGDLFSPLTADQSALKQKILTLYSLEDAVRSASVNNRAHIEALSKSADTFFNVVETGVSSVVNDMKDTAPKILEEVFSLFTDPDKEAAIRRLTDSVKGFWDQFADNFTRRATDSVAQFTTIITKSSTAQELSYMEKAIREFRNQLVEGTAPAKKFGEVMRLWGGDIDAAIAGLDLIIVSMRKTIPWVDKLAQAIKEKLFPKPAEADTKKIKELEELLEELSDDAATRNLTDLQLAIYDIGRAYEEAFPKGSDLLKENKEKVEELKKEIEDTVEALKDASKETAALGIASGGVGGLRGEISQLEFQRAAAEKLGDSDKVAEITVELKLKRAEDQVKTFQKSISDSLDTIGSALVDAFARGEKIAKIWSDVVANIWRSQMEKAMTSIADKIQTTIGKALAAAFSDSPGAAGAIAGAASALLTVVSGILANLNSKTETSIDDFSDSITESEAVRGVIAGPTNVAIARVGSALKEALQTTEQLLLRIAVSIEETPQPVALGSTRQPVNPGLSYNLSGSTVG